jgi:hypothetical protein
MNNHYRTQLNGQASLDLAADILISAPRCLRRAMVEEAIKFLPSPYTLKRCDNLLRPENGRQSTARPPV